MKVIVSPCQLSGQVDVPSSKSHFQRLLVGSLLCRQTSVIRFTSQGDDIMAVTKVIRTLGAKVVQTHDMISVTGPARMNVTPVHCMESGLCVRLFAPVLALGTDQYIITGEGSMADRPHDFMQDPFREAGAVFSSEKGKVPLRIKGPLKGGNIHVDGSVSSQFLSGLLMALPLAAKDSVITVSNLKSRPYVDLTLEVLRSFGIRVLNSNYEHFHVPGNQVYEPVNTQVEGDWSAAVNLLIAAATAGSIRIRGLSSGSSQADKAILGILAQAGVEMMYESGTFIIKESRINSFEADATHSPDLIPALVALAVRADGTSVIRGAGRLVYKESNRAHSIIEEFRKLNADIEQKGDLFFIKGGLLKGGTVTAHNDYRMAMALGVAALNANGPVLIEEAGSVNKSYPGFWNDLIKIGGKIRFLQESAY